MSDDLGIGEGSLAADWLWAEKGAASAQKWRPALLLAHARNDDGLLRPIKSMPGGDPHAVLIVDAEFTVADLQPTSSARPGKFFTAHASVVQAIAGVLAAAAHAKVRGALVASLGED